MVCVRKTTEMICRVHPNRERPLLQTIAPVDIRRNFSVNNESFSFLILSKKRNVARNFRRRNRNKNLDEKRILDIEI